MPQVQVTTKRLLAGKVARLPPMAVAKKLWAMRHTRMKSLGLQSMNNGINQLLVIYILMHIIHTRNISLVRQLFTLSFRSFWFAKVIALEVSLTTHPTLTPKISVSEYDIAYP